VPYATENGDTEHVERVFVADRPAGTHRTFPTFKAAQDYLVKVPRWSVRTGEGDYHLSGRMCRPGCGSWFWARSEAERVLSRYLERNPE
jgi:hypothetical protein